MEGSNCLNVKWVRGKDVGSGEFSTAYEIANDGDHIMKVITFDDDLMPYSKFDDMIRIQNLVASIDLTVPVVDQWVCNNNQTGVIVMKKLTAQLHGVYKNNKLFPKLKDKMNMIAGIREIYTRLFSHDISHGDVGLRNIMIDKKKYGVSPVKIVVSSRDYPLYLYLIDFQFSLTSDKYIIDDKMAVDELTKWMERYYDL